jgi:hypothetical protein
MPFHFTRYLYVKEEVEICLFISLLKRESDALFWAYELYFSGFLSEFRTLILNIYVYFYAPLNISLGKYLINQLNQMKKCPECVAKIILNLQARPFLLDVFLLEKQVKLFELDEEEERNVNLNTWDAALASFILNLKNEAQILTKFCTSQPLISLYALLMENGVKQNRILLSFACHQFCIENSKPMAKSCYVQLPSEDLVDSFKTIDFVKPYRVLPLAYQYETDPHDWLSLFALKRDNNGLRGCYFYHWLYFSLQTPFWREQLKFVTYEVDEIKKQVWFPNEDTIDFNLEPDEQTMETQNKVLKDIKRDKTWIQFVQNFGQNNIYKMDEAYLEEFGQLKCFV